MSIIYDFFNKNVFRKNKQKYIKKNTSADGKIKK